MNQKISIIIPCFNEKNTINELVNRVKMQSGFEKEIILVDDCSTDGTREILNEKINEKVDKILFNNSNKGKGFSIRKGISVSSGNIILIQDADLEYDPEEYAKLLNPILKDTADVVYGSRFVGSQEKRVLYFWHSAGNYFLTFLSNIFSNLNLSDMECCYKVFKSDILKKIDLKEDRFGFEPEVTAKIAKVKNIRIYEVGVKYFGRTYSEGKKITWKDGFSAIRCIIKYNLLK
tara:strand:+ start:38 stop:736 length:699 start_codon:yes stop_codon:yes gene_type:complete